MLINIIISKLKRYIVIAKDAKEVETGMSVKMIKEGIKEDLFAKLAN